MYTVGLTGGIGSGKSTLANAFLQQGTHCVDMDDIARLVVKPGEPALTQITQHFKHPQILLPTGELNRALLRRIVFEQPHQKAWLESLLHPLIRARSHAALADVPSTITNTGYAILISPLLFEKSIRVDASIAIDVSEDTQLKRACQRDNTSAKHIQRIMAAQLSRTARLAKADFIIDNNGSQNTVAQKVAALHQQLLAHFAEL